MDVAKSRELLVSRSMTSSWKWSPYQVRLLERKFGNSPVNPTLFAVIIGPGNSLRARVELEGGGVRTENKIQQHCRRLTGESTHQELLLCW